jgi:hypothetical protein
MCTGGECVTECPPHLKRCGDECVNTDFSADHCGGCGKPCAEGMACWRAACLTPLLSGATGGSWGEMSKDEGPAELPVISDFSPASEQTFYAGAGSSFFRFSSSWESLTGPDAAAPFPPNAGIAWAGNSLYFAYESGLFGFDLGLAPGRWVREAEFPVSAAYATQVTHDDDGAVYFLSADGRIVQYSPVTGDVAVDPNVVGPEPPWRPRLAWDTLTRRLYVAPRFDRRRLFEYDPKSKSVLELPGHVNDAMGSAFCSDRSGHLYTAGDDGLNAWQYTVWTQSWTKLPDVPRSLHPGAVCTILERRWLYFYRPRDLIRIELL